MRDWKGLQCNVLLLLVWRTVLHCTAQALSCRLTMSVVWMYGADWRHTALTPFTSSWPSPVSAADTVSKERPAYLAMGARHNTKTVRSGRWFLVRNVHLNNYVHGKQLLQTVQSGTLRCSSIVLYSIVHPLVCPVAGQCPVPLLTVQRRPCSPLSQVGSQPHGAPRH